MKHLMTDFARIHFGLPALLFVLPATAATLPKTLHARVAEEIGLTDDQSQRYQEAAKARDEAEGPLLVRQRASLTKVRLLIAASSSERTVARELEDLSSVFAQLRVVRLRYEAALAGGLSPLLQAKLAAAEAAAPRAGSVAVAGQDPRASVPGDEEEQE